MRPPTDHHNLTEQPLVLTGHLSHILHCLIGQRVMITDRNGQKFAFWLTGWHTTPYILIGRTSSTDDVELPVGAISQAHIVE